jgi:hypothetical protein
MKENQVVKEQFSYVMIKKHGESKIIQESGSLQKNLLSKDHNLKYLQICSRASDFKDKSNHSQRHEDDSKITKQKRQRSWGNGKMKLPAAFTIIKG